jgi:hypothetical protein
LESGLAGGAGETAFLLIASTPKRLVDQQNIGGFAAFWEPAFRAYPNNLVVMRLSEKPEAKTAGQKRSEAWFVPH